VKGDASKASALLGIDHAALAGAEAPVEQEVSRYLAAMPFLWLEINDEPGPNSQRDAIERNSIALLSNHDRTTVDPPSKDWLGHRSGRPLVRTSGLWNQRHVEKTHHEGFLDTFEKMIELMGTAGSESEAVQR
jgi:hypothetical protein